MEQQHAKHTFSRKRTKFQLPIKYEARDVRSKVGLSFFLQVYVAIRFATYMSSVIKRRYNERCFCHEIFEEKSQIFL